MNSPVAAIGWELWLRHRKAWICLGAVMPSFALLYVVCSPGVPEIIQVFHVFAGIFSLATVAWIFSYAEPDARGRHGGFPYRMYRLPMATWKLVACPVGLGAATMVVLYLAWAPLLSSGFRQALKPQAMAAHILTLVALQILLQAIVWSLYRFPWIRAGTLLVVVGGLGSAAAAARDYAYFGLGWGGFMCWLGGVSAVGYLAAWLGVHRDRCGDGKGWTGPWIRAVVDAWPVRRRSFVSPAKAQFWLEWRTKGWFLAVFLGVMMAATVMAFPIPMSLQVETSNHLFAFAGLFLMSWFTASTVGLNLAKREISTREVTLSSFLAVRPISTAGLVFSKMKCACVVTLVAWVLFAALSPLAYDTLRWLGRGALRAPSWQTFREANRALIDWGLSPWTVLTALALTWKWMIAALSMTLTGRHWFILWRGGLSLLLYATFIGLINWAYNDMDVRLVLTQVLPVATGILLLLKLALVIRSLVLTQQKNLYSTRQAAVFCGLWLALGACITVSTHAFLNATGLPPAFVWFTAALLWPGSEFFTCVLHLHANRHR